MPLEHLEFVVLFGARNPENTSLEKVEKMREIHVGGESSVLAAETRVLDDGMESFLGGLDMLEQVAFG